MNYLGNWNNVLRGNTLSLAVAAVVGSSAVYRTGATKTGGGQVNLSGTYTGGADATFDVEVLNNTIVGTPRVSSPTFSGVGNGTMTSVSATGGTPAQEIAVTLVDLGTETRTAYVPFQGVTLRAAASGATGNDIVVIVDQSGITRTPSSLALLDALSEGSNSYVGDQWDFGAVVANPDGTIPTSAPRISFGSDPQVYRPYKRFRDGRYEFSFAPAPVRGVAKGQAVKTVTGSYSVIVRNTVGYGAAAFQASHAYTLGQVLHPVTPNGHWYKVTVAGTTGGSEPTYPTNGSTVVSGTATLKDMGYVERSYTGVTTLYSLLAAIRADTHSLVTIDSAVVNDLAPLGMGTVEMSVRTSSYIASQTAEPSPYVKAADIGLTIGATQATEDLVIACTNADHNGAEVWSVTGSGTGAHPEATTGVPYSDGGYGFTIPVQLAPAAEPAGTLEAHLDLVERSGGGTVPALCVEDLIAGAEATTKTFTFIWTPRSVDCDCEDVETHGGPQDDLLGIHVEGSGVGSIPAVMQTPLETLFGWYSDFVTANTSLVANTTNPEAATVVAPGTDGSIPVDNNAQTVVNVGSPFYRKERVSAVLKSDRVDIDFARAATKVLKDTLQTIFDELDTIPGAAQTEWDAAMADLDSDTDVIDGLVGAEFWRKYSTYLDTEGAETDNNDPVRVAYGANLLTQEFETFLRRYKARMAKVCVLAGVMPPDFDSAGRQGNDVWQDHGGTAWFVSQDGLLPLQPGWYYHSCKNAPDATGELVPTPTYQFGIQAKIGCVEKLIAGDRLIISIDIAGNLRQTYQVGDQIVTQIIRAAPAQLGGGQTGTDVLTFSVQGSVSGAFADYSLSTVTPAAYSSGGIGFSITPGGIPFALGDRFSWYVEGGQFRWRKDGGSWSSATQIADTVALADGLSASFVVGAAPSFEPGDSYSFAAEAVYGVEQLRSPTLGRLKLDDPDGQIIVHGTSLAVSAVLFAGHTISAGAAVTYEAATDSGFTTGLVSIDLSALADGDIPAGNWFVELGETVTKPYHRIVIDEACEISWLWMGEPLALQIPTGQTELGRLTKRWRLPRALATKALGGQVAHSALAESSVADLIELIAYATENDDSAFAVVPNPAETAVALVRYTDDSLEVSDVLDHQPRDPADRLLSVTLNLAPV